MFSGSKCQNWLSFLQTAIRNLVLLNSVQCICCNSEILLLLDPRHPSFSDYTYQSFIRSLAYCFITDLVQERQRTSSPLVYVTTIFPQSISSASTPLPSQRLNTRRTPRGLERLDGTYICGGLCASGGERGDLVWLVNTPSRI